MSPTDVVQLQRKVGARRAAKIIAQKQQLRQPSGIQRAAAITAKQPTKQKPTWGTRAYQASSIIFGPLHDAVAYMAGNKKTKDGLAKKYDEMLFTRYNHRRDNGFSMALALINGLASMVEIVDGVAGTLSLISFLIGLFPGAQVMAGIGAFLGDFALISAGIAVALRAVLVGMHYYDILVQQVGGSKGEKQSVNNLIKSGIGMLGAGAGCFHWCTWRWFVDCQRSGWCWRNGWASNKSHTRFTAQSNGQGCTGQNWERSGQGSWQRCQG